eukprot:CAMPEP_0174358220 /NCGR_PEP_ID=MMETSP0811_2-20130205/41085_1 /TAXON_ID=73025 ORGANISM="Eutreptiella gymnastica-like, Strain CCMP1594" /NCGR_SAMPLE_ID=MMETSP0811_2 /ASSEMBLY_ACC=CAM_ASM_000667 /LENGTH=59 /DNA_ID=CAMNT_0015491807 /DNA_START=82 /DNA_END=261 /DNA_ORIENTATION=+
MKDILAEMAASPTVLAAAREQLDIAVQAADELEALPVKVGPNEVLRGVHCAGACAWQHV